MKIAVDVKRVVQEIDLDSGVTSNYLVFVLGGAEHTVEATEEQLQQAIREATILKNNGAPPFIPQPPVLGAVGEIPVGADPFVAGMIQDDVSDQEVRDALYGGDDTQPAGPVPTSLFEDVSGAVTEEDMAEYMTEGESTHGSVDVVSDGESDGSSFDEIMSAHQSDKPREDAPPTPTQQRHANIQSNRPHAKPKGQRAVIAGLRARARQIPARGLQAHQVDEAGNPMVPQTKKVLPAPPGFGPTDPNAPSVRMAPVPPGLAGLDGDDGFEQG